MRRLTKSVIDGLPPKSAPYITYCAALPGFGVRVMPTGRKVYLARYRTMAGVQRLHTIARTTDLSLDDARAEASRLFGAARGGSDPAQLRRDARNVEILADVFARYQREVKAYKKPKTHYFNEINWNVHLAPRFGKLRLNDITTAAVKDMMIDYAGKKPTANNCLMVLRKVLNYGKVYPNPCTGVRAYKVERPHRVLTTAELQRIEAELDLHTDWFALLIRLLILTGARLREIMHAETAWINLEERTLSLPDSKTGVKVIRLPAAACALLRGCDNRKYLIQEPWRNEPLKYPHGSWRKLCRDAGIERIRMHDLRHSFGSRAHAAGVSQRDIAALLGHKQLRTTERYLHAFNDGNGGKSPTEIAAEAMRGLPG